MVVTITGDSPGDNTDTAINWRYVYTDGTFSAWSSNLNNAGLDDFELGEMNVFAQENQPVRDTSKTLDGVQLRLDPAGANNRW
eukprot:CAMPEP_0168509404 /NCGR_PEP_ID=MMETSP0405-20121227/750_1 /TAXON_ID=498012 /ORGANISM="Trichosphaerium sp, Strain Am-I-7 wt" /LENGTH=82 /DNA_ID=CAMNT_0008526845 /DNA_START=84 /DNA_END=329 /DNA_ORIENTATION=-